MFEENQGKGFVSLFLENQNTKKENMLWNALEAMSVQPESEGINKLLSLEKQKTIKESDLWVPVCTNFVAHKNSLYDSTNVMHELT